VKNDTSNLRHPNIQFEKGVKKGRLKFEVIPYLVSVLTFPISFVTNYRLWRMCQPSVEHT